LRRMKAKLRPPDLGQDSGPEVERHLSRNAPR